MKVKRFTIAITAEDYLDVTLHINKGEIGKFSLNYRSLIKNKWKEIYRIDNYHGFLHEQRFWVTNKPIPLTERINIQEQINNITQNYKKFKKYYKENEQKRRNNKSD